MAGMSTVWIGAGRGFAASKGASSSEILQSVFKSIIDFRLEAQKTPRTHDQLSLPRAGVWG